ncbi:hypothetical protein [Arthrobacter sp. TMS2-4]
MNKKAIAIALASIATLTLTAPPETASDEATTIAPLSELAPEVLSGAAEFAQLTLGPGESHKLLLDKKFAEISTDPTDGVSISSEVSTIDLGLPFAATADQGVVDQDGHLTFDNNNSTWTTPVVKDDGSVQITTTIESPNAPEEFAYPVDLPEGASITLQKDGGAAFFAADGSYLGGFAAP